MFLISTVRVIGKMSQKKILKNIKSNVQCWAKIKQENLHFPWVRHDLR